MHANMESGTCRTVESERLDLCTYLCRVGTIAPSIRGTLSVYVYPRPEMPDPGIIGT